ncbi:AAA family ATPase [Candidatus Poriferisodalis sp.]|uniref:McrB family protein n=1 Tax=Candidatus Poriferisodalis sp. TaxID=3101277 RepID=UPI003D0B3DCE
MQRLPPEGELELTNHACEGHRQRLIGVLHPSCRFAAMDERQQWMQRLDEFSDYLREDRRVGSSAQGQYRSIVERWIDFALSHAHDPSTFDQLLIEELLDRQRDLKDNSRAAYASNLSVWCRWASNEPVAGREANTGEPELHDDIALWMARLEEYLSYLQHRGRQQPTISNRRAKLSKWIRFACSAGRNPAAWDPPAIEEAFIVWGTVDSPRQRDDIRGRIRAWCKYWSSSGLDALTLGHLVQQFRDGGYPDDDVPHRRAARAEFEQVLNSLPSLSYGQRDQLRAVWNTSKYDYGGAGVAAGMHTALRDVSEADWPRMRDQIYSLCHGPGDLATRFDETIANVRGLGELMATRMLAITWPNRFLPNFLLRTTSSQWPGKLEMIELLDRLDLLDASTADEARVLLDATRGARSVGELVVRSNDLLAEVLDPFFGDGDFIDTWGMAQFLYWLDEHYANDGADSGDDEDADEADSYREHLATQLGDAAEDLLCGVGFLNDIVELLEDKGQVILYGPPGTGKTYFARHLAWTLSGIRDDEEYENDGPYSLVQFHPAYSYEDFFEGFRPRVDDNGQMTFELTPGPLVRLAQRAEQNPHERHVMVIDEINRANLPRVLGELLYLLEYRDEWTQTQYRPEDGFTLPSNLWFIGTMNTADRSIALIDAAMRRRFHFVPFFPNHGQTKGLLRRWIQRNSPGREWVAGLVDKVNNELAEQMGDDHSLIGPSHFMKRNLDKDGLRRIWEYNIEPLVEDQLFGRQEAIDSFRFGSVWRRFGPGATSSGAQPGEPDDQSAGAADEAGSLTGESEGVAEEGDA